MGRRHGQFRRRPDAGNHGYGGQRHLADQHRDHHPRRPVRPEHGQRQRQRYRDAAASRSGSDQHGERRGAQRGRRDHLHRHALQSGPRRRHGGAGGRLAAGRCELCFGQSQPGHLHQRHRTMERRHGRLRRRADAGNHGYGGQRHLAGPNTGTITHADQFDPNTSNDSASAAVNAPTVDLGRWRRRRQIHHDLHGECGADPDYRCRPRHRRPRHGQPRHGDDRPDKCQGGRQPVFRRRTSRRNRQHDRYLGAGPDHDPSGQLGVRSDYHTAISWFSSAIPPMRQIQPIAISR